MHYSWRIAASVVLLLIGLSPGPGAVTAGQSVLIEGVPHRHQASFFSGEACAAMFLSRRGGRVRPSDVFNRAGIDPQNGRGCRPQELCDALRRLGVATGAGVVVLPASPKKAVERQFKLLRADLARGVASIVTLRASHAGVPVGAGSRSPRFLLVVGYDADKDRVVYHDPARRDGASLHMTRTRMLADWPRGAKPAPQSLVRIALATRRPVVVERTEGFSPADYAGHIYRLRARLPSSKFHIVVSKPFVVVGDLSTAELQTRATGTVKWAVERLKAEYFRKDPDQILDVWLFKDEVSYKRYTKELFGDRPTTPYGYYSRRHRALIMNIATGGGTLVHEIVHPFMAANFAECPAWFNEGLASLYEQSGDREGRIRGFTNWRLRGLQKSIGDQRVPPFRTLCETTSDEFYRKDPGTNYAQARYLCYYLQQRGLLRKYYHEFRRSASDDPSGHKTLVRVLGNPDMRTFQKEWEGFVLKLRF